MKGLMQDWPLVISSILDHAAREHPQQEIVTNAVEGTIRRCHYRDLHSRARKVAKALVSAGIKPGDRVATMGLEHRSPYGSLVRHNWCRCHLSYP